MPVVPVTQETKAGEWHESGGRGCSEPRSHHCTPAWATKQDSINQSINQSINAGPGAMAHDVIPALWEAEVRIT